jgi:uncharacterized protein (DUF1697 family)
MTKYVVFLRGVNVGGRVIKMTELKTCLEKAGFKNVKTVLQSGNVLFESDKTAPRLKTQIEEILTETFNYPAKAQVILFDNLRGIIAGYPFGPAQPDYHQYVIFIEDELEAQLVAEAGSLLGEQVQAGLGIVYWTVKKGDTLKSPFAKLLTKSKYQEFNTVRNINTLKKLI